jgi:copper chaperone CopZ
MEMSNYVHSIPGRLRVKTALIKKNSGEAEKVERLLQSISGVQSLEINLITGSVLMRYNPSEVSADMLLQLLAEAGYFEAPKAVTHDEIIYSALAKTGRTVGSLVLGSLEIENRALAILAALI